MENNGGFVPSVTEAHSMVRAQEILHRARLLMAPERGEMEISLHGPMERAWHYLESQRTNTVNRFLDSDGHKYSTLKAFFAMEEPMAELGVIEHCVTGNHQLDTHGETTCKCHGVESCGCTIDPDNVSICDNCDRCMDCCDSDSACFTCEGCDKRLDSSYEQCSNCESCTDCCNCFYCEAHCRSHSHESRSRCDNCHNCTDMCSCDRDDEDEDGPPSFVNLRGRGLKFHDSERKAFKINPLHRHISCEIEVDGADDDACNNNGPLNRAIDKWGDSVVEDGSLEGNQAHEINTQPTNGDAFVKHIQELCAGYSRVHATASNSCGLHVHVDTRDFHFYDVRRLILTYTKVERALFELCDPARLNACFSQICGQNYTNMSSNPDLFKRQILSGLYMSDSGTLLPKHGKSEIANAKSHKYAAVRYRALNVHSHFFRKSIEFRHHEGTVNGQEIINWALIVANVVQTAYVSSEAKIMALPTGSREALLSMLPISLHQHCTSKWSVWDEDARTSSRDSMWDSQELTTYSKLPTREPVPEHRDRTSGGKKRCKVPRCRKCEEKDARLKQYKRDLEYRERQDAMLGRPWVAAPAGVGAYTTDRYGRRTGETGWCADVNCDMCQSDAIEENVERDGRARFMSVDFAAIEQRVMDGLTNS